MKKNVWYPGDIITTEKWNRINNNISLPGAYKLPITIEEASGEGPREINSSYNITINKSFNEIINLIKQGVICYFVTETDFGGETELLHNIFIAESFNIGSNSSNSSETEEKGLRVSLSLNSYIYFYDG